MSTPSTNHPQPTENHQTYWLLWRPSISRMTPFSWSLAPVYFKDCCLDFLLALLSSLRSSLIDRREFLYRHDVKLISKGYNMQNEVTLLPTLLLPVEVVEAGFNVRVIVVDLVLVESCLRIESIQSLLELYQLSFPSLSVTSLVADVLSRTKHEKEKISILLWIFLSVMFTY